MDTKIKDKKNVDIDEGLEMLTNTLDAYVEENRDKDSEIVYTAYTFLKWLRTKTEIVQNEKTFTIPDPDVVKRGNVVWVEFGFNIGQEFGGRHPAIIYRVTGEQVFVFPLTTQQPKKEKPQYVRIPIVYDFPKLKRWVNVLNLKCVSVNRIDFTSRVGRVKGESLDDISAAWKKIGIK